MNRLHVLNTRPAERADELNQALQAAGYQVSQLPLLELVAEPFDRVAANLALIQHAGIIVVVSPAAAYWGLAGLKQLEICPDQLACQWVAVGQTTAAVLADAGIKAHVPAVETSEGMLALEIFQPQQASSGAINSAPTVMFWRGHGGREFMLQHLASQQRVISVNLYRRQLPASSASSYPLLLNQPPQVLLISSGVSWQNWLELGQQFGFIIPAYILVLGQRVYQQVRRDIDQQLGLSSAGAAAQPRVILLDTLTPASILSLLEQLQKYQ